MIILLKQMQYTNQIRTKILVIAAGAILASILTMVIENDSDRHDFYIVCSNDVKSCSMGSRRFFEQFKINEKNIMRLSTSP